MKHDRVCCFFCYCRRCWICLDWISLCACVRNISQPSLVRNYVLAGLEDERNFLVWTLHYALAMSCCIQPHLALTGKKKRLLKAPEIPGMKKKRIRKYFIGVGLKRKTHNGAKNKCAIIHVEWNKTAFYRVFFFLLERSV